MRVITLPPAEVTRRQFLHYPVAMMAGGLLWRINTRHAWRVTTVSVRDFGAVGDGVSDDTSAFDRALKSLPRLGGTVLVPDGDYRIDPVRSVRLRDGTILQMSARAILRAIPTAASQSAVVHIETRNVQVVGGTIVGERREHRGSGGEWGMGIQLRSATGVVVDGVQVRDCWGDGIYVGANQQNGGSESRNVTIRRCHLANNRRQGLSLTAAIGVNVEDSTFADTNGTSPASGIDLEPNKQTIVRDVVIARCAVTGNAGRGIILSGSAVTNVRIEDTKCTANEHEGILIANASSVILQRNVIEGNGTTGLNLALAVRKTEVARNIIRDNSRKTPRKADNIFIDRGSSENRIHDNDFTPKQAGVASTRFDVNVNGRDCTANEIARNRLSRVDAVRSLGAATVILP